MSGVVDFSKLIPDDYDPPVFPRVDVDAVRYNCVSGEPSSVTVTLELRPPASRPNEPWVFIVQGGVTGFESADWSLMRDDLRTGSERVAAGWCACAGTEGRWDRLVIGLDSLIAAADRFENATDR